MRVHSFLALSVALGATTACAQSRDDRPAVAVDVTRADTSHVSGDPLASRADSLVRAGRHWRATILLASRLRQPASAPPETRLVGARAAAGWEGWTEVDRLLRGTPWLDSLFAGEGRELLARAELERAQDARADARLAVADARTDASRVTRLVLLARALDRANELDSAAASYSAAARRVPEIADWLALRAAGAMNDSAARARTFALVTTAGARARIPYTDAQARERTGDFAGAARVYRAVRDEGSAFRVEALAAHDAEAKAGVARRIVAYLAGRPAAAPARQSLVVLDGLGATLARNDELIVARTAAEAGAASRAVKGFRRAAAAPLSPRDRYLYAGALLDAGDGAEAARQYASVNDPQLAPAASYGRARALLRAGSNAAARSALRSTAADYVTTPTAAAPALLLLADLQVDDGDLPGAARSLAELTERYPESPQAPLALFRSGLIDWSASPTRAAATFDRLVQRHPKDEEVPAARYWAGRAYDRAGNRAEAERRWKAIIAASPLSYYSGLAARRLKIAGWQPPAGADTAAHVAGVDSAVRRIAALQRLGMDVESRFEIDLLAERAERSPSDAAAVADALIAIGEPARALRVALSATDRGASSRAIYRAAFPIVHLEALTEESRRHDLDPALVAGLIRQESSFNPRAVSPAGARGLMQLMPPVGASIAKSLSYPLWDPSLLFDPDVSLELGTAHLASSLKRAAPPARALAAYNAGASRVARWIGRPGSDDPELFTEWIPYAETRDYVRIVQRNAEIYRALYRF